MKLPTWPDPNNKSSHFGLERILTLLEKLGNPQDKMKNVFHIAGTNGKGSTTAFLKAILEANGYTTNRDTSPHLVEFNERIELKGQKITDNYYNELSKEVREIVEKNNLEITYFEAITAVGFLAFSRNNADANIIEVGCGGRLDSTNVFKNPLVDIITTISYDHMAILGDTLEKIAPEKWGIVKPNTPVVLGYLNEKIKNLYREQNKEFNNKLYFFGEDYKINIIDNNNFEFIYGDKKMLLPTPSLKGEHQIRNASCAIMALLSQNKLKITEEAIKRGLTNCFWPARLQNLKNTKLSQYLPDNYELYLDGAHNEDGARVLSKWLEDENKIDQKETIMILSILERKDSKTYLNNLKNTVDYAIAINNHNPDFKFKSGDVLKQELEENGIKVLNVAETTVEALQYIKNIDKGTSKRVLICGSLYYSAQVLELIK